MSTNSHHPLRLPRLAATALLAAALLALPAGAADGAAPVPAVGPAGDAATPALGADASTVAATTSPTAVDDSVSTLWNTPVTIPFSQLLANDKGSDLSIVHFGGPTHGSLTLNASSVTYTPPSGCTIDSDSFTYTIANAAGLSTATVHVSIGGIICSQGS